MNNKYASAVMMAEQQSNFAPLTNYDRDRTLFSQHDNNCLQHHVYQERSTYNEVPTSSVGYVDNQISANVRAFLAVNNNIIAKINLSTKISLSLALSLSR